MRKASDNYGLIIENDKFIGISLGYDYCAEHEWGIEDIKRDCGIPDSSSTLKGVASRTITKCPKLVFDESIVNSKHFAILYTGNPRRSESIGEYVPHDLKNYKLELIGNEKWTKDHPTRDNKDTIITAWDKSGFGVAVMGEKEVGYLRDLYQAFQNNSITIATTALGAFTGSSLCLLITDRIPEETHNQLLFTDNKYYDREEYEERIGMKAIIKKHGRGHFENKLHSFMACSPEWIAYGDEEIEKRKATLSTKYDIQYWVNYSDDDDNYGWYTVEEISEWMLGTKKLAEIRKSH